MANMVRIIVAVAVLVTMVYSFIVVVARDPDIEAWLCLGFHALLLVNTFYSVSFTEDRYAVRAISDGILSTPLGLAYFLFPWLVKDSTAFFLAMGLFFSLAAARYANWLNYIDASFFIRRKVIANSAGAILCIGTLLGLRYFDHQIAVLSTTLGLYTYGNIHTLAIDPLYRHK